jgi:hypothetical protein
MQSLTSLFGGGGRYSQFEKLTGSGLWVPPAGVQLVHVALVGAGGGGGTFGVGYSSTGQALPNYSYVSPGGGGGGYLEFDYPVLDRASIAYSAGVGGDGATCVVTSGKTTSAGSSTANAITASYFDATWKVPASMVTALQAAGCPVVLSVSADSAVGANTITLNADPAALGVLAGWAVSTGFGSATLGTIQSISGNTITLTGTLASAVSSGTKLYMYPTGACVVQFYVPSTGHVFGHVAITSVTSVIALCIVTAPTASDLASALNVTISAARYTGSNGGDTTFGEYSAKGGYGSGSGGTVAVPGLQAISLQSTSNFPYQTSGAALAGNSAGSLTSTYPSSTSGGRAGGGFMSAGFSVGVPGSNGSDGGPGCGGASCLPTNSADPVPVGGRGGDGLLVILY